MMKFNSFFATALLSVIGGRMLMFSGCDKSSSNDEPQPVSDEEVIAAVSKKWVITNAYYDAEDLERG